MKIVLAIALTAAVLLTFTVESIESIDQTKFHKSNKGNVYFIENQYQNDWFQSLTRCARMNMSLLTVDSNEKSDDVNSLVLKKFGKNVVLWVGGYAVGPSRQYTWIATGEEFVYTFWHGSNPDYYNKAEYCAQIGWGPKMQWNDNSCAAKFGYICEYRHSPAMGSKDEKKDHDQKYRNVAINFYNKH